VYSSSLVKWRKQRAEGHLNPKTPMHCGPAAAPQPNDTAELDRLRRDNARLERQLAKARLVIGIQKKAAQIMDIDLDPIDETP
jgi:transposase-like protein